MLHSRTSLKDKNMGHHEKFWNITQHSLKRKAKNLQSTLHMLCRILQETFKTGTIQYLVLEKSKVSGCPREICCGKGNTLENSNVDSASGP